MSIIGAGRRGIFDINRNPGFGVGYGPGGPYDPAALVAREQAPRKASFLGEGGAGRGIAGAIGDFLLQNAGAAPIYQPAMARQQQQQLEESQYQRRRADGMDDYRQKQAIDAQFAPPKRNDTELDFEYIKGVLGEGAAKDFLRNKTLPPPFVQKNADGTSTIYPQGIARGSGGTGPQPGEVVDGYRFKGGDPNSQGNWEPDQTQPAPTTGGLPAGIQPGSPQAFNWLINNLPRNRVPLGSPVRRP